MRNELALIAALMLASPALSLAAEPPATAPRPALAAAADRLVPVQIGQRRGLFLDDVMVVIRPYYRAPHLYIGMPSMYGERGWPASLCACGS